jgi:hypothetical protein
MLNNEEETNRRDETVPRNRGTVTRKCLMCKEVFASEWSGERVCKRCRSSGAWKHPAAYRSV